MTNTHEYIDAVTNVIINESPNAATHAPKITDVTAQLIRRSYLEYRKSSGDGTGYGIAYCAGRADAIVWLLDELGIEIEKVNDVKAEVDGL